MLCSNASFSRFWTAKKRPDHMSARHFNTYIGHNAPVFGHRSPYVITRSKAPIEGQALPLLRAETGYLLPHAESSRHFNALESHLPRGLTRKIILVQIVQQLR